ncbi:MAG: hypothetical protein WBP85_05365 [Terracidiphilus sp.]
MLESAPRTPGKKTDLLAEYQATPKARCVLMLLLQSNPKDIQPYLDRLITRRDAGTLAPYVKERADAACKK